MTIRHERVLDEYLQNGNVQMNAYMTVYPKSSMSSARTQSTILFQRQEVIDMIASKQAQLRDAVLITKEEIVNVLVGIMNDAKDDPKTSSISIKAIVELDKILGYNTPIKTELDFKTNNKKLSDLLGFDDEAEEE